MNWWSWGTCITSSNVWWSVRVLSYSCARLPPFPSALTDLTVCFRCVFVACAHAGLWDCAWEDIVSVIICCFLVVLLCVFGWCDFRATHFFSHFSAFILSLFFLSRFGTFQTAWLAHYSRSSQTWNSQVDLDGVHKFSNKTDWVSTFGHLSEVKGAKKKYRWSFRLMVVGSALAGRFRLCATFVSAWWIRFHPPPPSSIRSPPFGPLHSLSPLGLAIRIHRCSTQTTLTPSFYENKTTTAIAETNKKKKKDVFAKRSLYTMHLMHPASSRYVGSEFFQALRFFLFLRRFTIPVLLTCDVFFFVRCVSFMPRPIANVVVVRATIHRVFTSMASRCCSCADCNPSLSKRRGYVQF